MDGSCFLVLSNRLYIFVLQLVLIHFPQFRVNRLQSVADDECNLQRINSY